MPSVVPRMPATMHGGEADDHGHARAEDEAREHVTSHVVGAEEMGLAAPRLPRGGTEAIAEHADLGIVGGDDVGEDGHERDDAEDDRGNPGKALDAERGEAPRQAHRGRGVPAWLAFMARYLS